jgi:maltooligosyltrehalose trehalohydrolase
MPRVWAPFSGSVSLVLDRRLLQMQEAAKGWWASDVELEDGQDYQFQLDHGVFPDPRSPWQPYGVHGPSRVVTHDSFRWSDRSWQAPPLSSAIIYELHVGTFTPEGTFDAVGGHLDHLIQLGVTHLELMPVAQFLGQHGWGYDGVFPFAPHQAYGGPQVLKRLVNACHERGLAVILDVVYNHLGPSGNYLPRYGPYYSDKHSTPWGQCLNFDGPHSEEVRRFFCDNARMWLRDYHFDGLRLDAIHQIADASALPFLEQLSIEVTQLEGTLGRHLVLIAESDLNDPRIIRPTEMGGLGLDAHWADDLHHAVHSVVTSERDGYYRDFGRIEDLATAMRQPYVYDGRFSVYRQRRHGRPAESMSPSRFVVCLQNHDQIGNRARGERIGHLVNPDRLKIAAALVLLSDHVPLLFQGEEWSASSPFCYFVDFGEEPSLAEAVSDGRLREFSHFGWTPEVIRDPSCRSSFLDSRLYWEETEGEAHADILAWYRRLVSLRRYLSGSGLIGGQSSAACQSDESGQWLIVKRGRLIIACNFATSSRALPINCERGEFLLCSKATPCQEEAFWLLEQQSVAVFLGADTQISQSGHENCRGPNQAQQPPANTK